MKKDALNFLNVRVFCEQRRLMINVPSTSLKMLGRYSDQ